MSIVEQLTNFISYSREYENPSLKEFVYGVILNIVALVISALEFSGGNFGNVHTNIPVFFIILLVLFVLYDVYLIHVTLQFRKAIIERENFIKLVVQNRDPLVEAVYMRDTHTVKRNGSNNFRRELELKRIDGIDEKVFWYEMGLGTTNGLKKSIFPKDFYVKRSCDNKLLPRIYYGVDDTRRKYAIILDPILDDNDKRCRFYAIRKKWKNVWNDLVDCKTDTGRIKINFPVQELQYSIILPPKYLFVENECKVDNRLNVISSFYHLDNQNIWTFKAENVVVGEYNYELRAIKVQKSN